MYFQERFRHKYFLPTLHADHHAFVKLTWVPCFWKLCFSGIRNCRGFRNGVNTNTFERISCRLHLDNFNSAQLQWERHVQIPGSISFVWEPMLSALTTWMGSQWNEWTVWKGREELASQGLIRRNCDERLFTAAWVLVLSLNDWEH